MWLPLSLPCLSVSVCLFRSYCLCLYSLELPVGDSRALQHAVRPRQQKVLRSRIIFNGPLPLVEILSLRKGNTAELEDVQLFSRSNHLFESQSTCGKEGEEGPLALRKLPSEFRRFFGESDLLSDAFKTRFGFDHPLFSLLFRHLHPLCLSQPFLEPGLVTCLKIRKRQSCQRKVKQGWKKGKPFEEDSKD